MTVDYERERRKSQTDRDNSKRFGGWRLDFQWFKFYVYMYNIGSHTLRNSHRKSRIY